VCSIGESITALVAQTPFTENEKLAPELALLHVSDFIKVDPDWGVCNSMVDPVTDGIDVLIVPTVFATIAFWSLF
jgi:hypothetical protein